MERIHRIFFIVSVTLLVSVLVALPVLAYLFSAPVTIQETTGVAYTMIGAQDDLPTTWLVSQGMLDSNGLDSDISPDKPHMVVVDSLYMATALPAYGQVNVNFSTGNTPAASMAVVPGYNGYVTVRDAAALELGSNGQLEITDVYINTAVAGYIVNKPCAVAIGSDGAGNVIMQLSIAGSYSSSASDGTAYGADAVYNTCRTMANATSVASGAATGLLGQDWDTVNYKIWRDCFYFPTAAIPDGATICSAYFALWVTGDGSATDFDITVTNGQPTRPSDPLVAGDYDQSLYAGSGGTLTTAGIAVGAYNNINLNATGMGWINKTADTKLMLRSSRDIGGNAPGGTEDVVIAYSENGAGSIPKLVLTYYESTLSVAKASGEYDIDLTVTAAAGGTMTLTVDGTVDTDVGLGAVIGNNSDWIIGSNSSPYFGVYEHTVGGVLVAWYQPNDIIRGQAYAVGTVTVTNGDATVTGAGGAAWTADMDGGLFISTDGIWYVIDSVTDGTHIELATVYGGGTLGAQAYNFYPRLPDRQGALQDGLLTLGTNPGGVTMVVASMSGYSGSFTDVTDDTPPDRLPEVPVSDWYGDGTITKAATLANPLRPLVQMVSDNTTLTEIQTWRWYGVILLVVAVVLFGRLARGHQGITAIAAGAILALLIAFDSSIFPLYVAVLSAGLIIGGIISERSHQL